jgi:hypothetical protein
VIQENIKKICDKRTKEDNFELGDLVLRWDYRNEDKGKHGKFYSLWKGPYTIQVFRGNNAFILANNDGLDLSRGPINGRMLKHYLPPQKRDHLSIPLYISFLLRVFLGIGVFVQMFEAHREGPKTLKMSSKFLK